MSDRPCEVCTFQHHEYFCTDQEKLQEHGCPFMEIKKLKEQDIRIIQREFGQVCSFCGWEIEASSSSWEALQEHVQHCKKHPVFLLREEVKKLSNSLNNCLYLLEDYQGTNADMLMIEKAQRLLV